jgi:hypothetical protein
MFLMFFMGLSFLFSGSYRDIMFCGFYVWVSSVYVVPMSLASLLFEMWLTIRMFFVSQVFKCQISSFN